MKQCMAANWKMFKTIAQAGQTARELVQQVAPSLPSDREVLLIPPFTALQAVAAALGHTPGFALGAQNFYPAEQGAYTGEIAPDMLLDAGCSHALVGHSERRHILGETDEFLAQKVSFGLQAGLKIILCIGETLEERTSGRVNEVLDRQLGSALENVSAEGIAERLAIAYEPVWAIGTGEVAQSQDIAEAHATIRDRLAAFFPGQAPELRILYGGSVKSGNASEIICIDNVDGVLVGGAGLQADSFSQIVLAGR